MFTEPQLNTREGGGGEFEIAVQTLDHVMSLHNFGE